jgi:nucleoside-diphosphate-sugar epimerase
VDRIKQLGSSRVEAESTENLMAHAQALDAAVRFVAPAAESAAAALPASPTNVFITGATGFVGTFSAILTAHATPDTRTTHTHTHDTNARSGAFLVREVMQRTNGRVLCLVRADSPKHALARLEASLKAHAVWRDEWLERLVLVPGDLARPRLGLDEAQFLELARSVDAILHNGAFLHWLHPYKALAPANVLGTQEVFPNNARYDSK